MVPADAAAFTREVVAPDAPASKAGLSYCPSCGAAVQASWRFCANCSAHRSTPWSSSSPARVPRHSSPEVVRSSMADPLPSRSPRSTRVTRRLTGSLRRAGTMTAAAAGVNLAALFPSHHRGAPSLASNSSNLPALPGGSPSWAPALLGLNRCCQDQL